MIGKLCRVSQPVTVVFSRRMKLVSEGSVVLVVSVEWDREMEYVDITLLLENGLTVVAPGFQLDNWTDWFEEVKL